MKYNDLTVQESIIRTIKQKYNLVPIEVGFIPVGEESFAYKVKAEDGSNYFIKYCEHRYVTDVIDRVNNLLLQLKDFDFVVPPVLIDGQTSFVLGEGKLYCYPYVDGEVVKMGNSKFDQDLVNQLTEVMAKIHNATNLVTVDLPEEPFSNNFQNQFDRIQDSAEAGELEDDVKQLFLKNKDVLQNLINKHDQLGQKYQSNKPEYVLTHGDITGLNIILSPDGLKLVDWDGAMFAPRERDINFLEDNPYFSSEKYSQLTRNSKYNPEIKEYYGQQWALESILSSFENLRDRNNIRADKDDYVTEIEEYLCNSITQPHSR